VVAQVSWNSDQIEHLEGAGFVMSGSRHKRMNEVRVRKENQVYTAEQKRLMALSNYEVKMEREDALMAEFRALLASRNAAAAAGGDGGAGAASSSGAAEKR
jgi:hypothetical protein